MARRPTTGRVARTTRTRTTTNQRGSRTTAQPQPRVTQQVDVTRNINTSGSESDFRVSILNSLLTTPHRQMNLIENLHTFALERDPLFYGHLGVWYNDKGEVRDHKIAFIGNMLTSPVQEHRDAGFMLLQKLPPEQVSRVVSFVLNDLKRWTKKGLPGSGQTAIKTYLRSIESHESRLDGACVRMRKHMTYLYAITHTKPSDRAKAILFEDKPPKGSLPDIVRKIRTAKDPAKQAELIVKHKIPYPVATSVIKKMTPSVLVALIDSMSPQELVNNMSSLKERGAMDNADIKKLVDAKLKTAVKNKRVSVGKIQKAAQVAGTMKEELERTADEVMQAKSVKIGRPTALLIDISGSLDIAIEVGRQLASLIGAACTNNLYVYAFNDMPYVVKVNSSKPGEPPTLSDWTRATQHLRANGGTSVGSPLRNMIQNKEYVEQFVIITDEDENRPPSFADAYDEYSKALTTKPGVWFVRVGRWTDKIEKQLQKKGIECGGFTFNGDYYSLPNILPLLAQPTMLDLLMEIMNYPLPERSALVTATPASASA